MSHLIRLLRELLTAREKLLLVGLLGLTIVNGLVEMAALAALLPLTNQITGGESESLGWLDRLFSIGGKESLELPLIAGVVLAVYMVKNTFSLFLVYVQQRFGASIENRLVMRLFSIYLTRPYSFHLRNNSAVLIRNVQENSVSLVTFGITPVLTIATDVAVATSMLLFLAYLDLLGTIAVIAVFSIGTMVFLKLSRPMIYRLGSSKNTARANALKVLMQGLGGIKEIKAAGYEQEFLYEHRRHHQMSTRASYLFSFMQHLPRSVFEVLAFFGVATLVFSITATGRPATDAVGILAIFAAAAFRILPSLTRVSSSFQALSFGGAQVRAISQDLREDPENSLDMSSMKSVQFASLEFRELSFSYEGAPSPALDSLNLKVSAGEYVGFVGTSGAGKTTLIDVLLGLLVATKGTFVLNGEIIGSDKSSWQRIIGYVPQSTYLLDDTIRRNVAFSLRDERIDQLAVEEALRAAQLWDFVQSLPEGLDTETGERGVRLSGGQRQRLGIARALYRRPQVLVFDEATSALDLKTEQEVIKALDQLRREHTLIVVAHRLTTLRNCDRLYKLESGRIVDSGSYEKVINSVRSDN